MLPALIRLLSSQPAWVAGHAEAYADLLSAEVASATAVWRRRSVLTIIALCSLVVAAILAGVATMLAALAPQIDRAASWALLLTPAVPLVVAVSCWLTASQQSRPPALAGVREQLRADLAMWRELTAK
jgi:hypothetical protein